MHGNGRATNRGQSGPLGLILVFALVIASTTAVVVVGAEAITTTQGRLDVERTENTMTQFDSKVALVALGQSSVQQVDLPASGDSVYDVRGDAGWMNITYTNASGDVTTIRNGSLGAVVYDGEGTEIAYQGGGVWRTDADGQAVMISPPEFHYRSRTLTLPLVTVTGDETIESRAAVTRNDTTQYFPDRARDEAFRNPLNGSDINVTVQSAYYRAWGSYFEERTDGTVTYDHSKETVTAELVIPFNASFDNVAATTDPSGLSVKGAGSPPSPYSQGVSFPSVDSRIEDKIDDCESGVNCDDSPPSTISSSGTYYYDTDPGSLTVDNPGGNVSIVVDDDFTSDTVEINGVDDNEVVTVYVRRSFTLTNEMNKNAGDPTDLKTLVHSDGAVELKGSTTYVGVLIAPGSTCEQRGSGTVEGGVICKQISIRGNPSNTFDYNPAIQEMGLDLTDPSDTQITYLHVSVNDVNVTGS
ncbi:hypothetical protein Har1130_05185 [Haloarcula sp. CBA1130]|uniref:DUF7289 family protein n=1 Tax=unclassified Haloarcula TaxID=2624677 RepID=UPI00124861C1|nr:MULTISPECIES: hypothetical protein [unclassified Haloarcula]KAA9398151.1 hypothetical protein Har1129_07955 [Haloarcula sp. CBA1129]KAA9402162.1 hypothetical protein Har1130_05185 [Haloarcula sp. CBA1130]